MAPKRESTDVDAVEDAVEEEGDGDEDESKKTEPLEHPYTLSRGGIQKFSTTAILCSLREPDAFDAIRTMSLSMMATVERHDLHKPDPEVKNVGMILGLIIRLGDFAEDSEDFGDLLKHAHAHAAKHTVVRRDLLKDSEPEEPAGAGTGKDSLPEPSARRMTSGVSQQSWRISKKSRRLVATMPISPAVLDLNVRRPTLTE
ncbi:hypothetical protein F1880_008600 [Penicillium rolfsii]|nr:hypothetical protein F1880_008600 [Penicillium rolfsii]